jgi:hypothetical protein
MVQDGVFSGGHGDHGLSLIYLFAFMGFAFLYYKRTKHLSIFRSLYTAFLDGYSVVIVITFFFEGIIENGALSKVLFTLYFDFGFVFFWCGVVAILLRLTYYNNSLSGIIQDAKYVALWILSYAPLVIIWKFVLNGANYLIPADATMPVALWEESLVLYICVMYYFIVIRHLK